MFSVGFQTHRHKKSFISFFSLIHGIQLSCLLDVDYTAWLVAVPSEVDGFQTYARSLKPIKITTDQTVVTNLNTSVNPDFNCCNSFVTHKETGGRNPIYMLPSPIHTCLTTMDLSLWTFISLKPYTLYTNFDALIPATIVSFCCCCLPSLDFGCNSLPFLFPYGFSITWSLKSY